MTKEQDYDLYNEDITSRFEENAQRLKNILASGDPARVQDKINIYWNFRAVHSNSKCDNRFCIAVTKYPVRTAYSEVPLELLVWLLTYAFRAELYISIGLFAFHCDDACVFATVILKCLRIIWSWDKPRF